MTYFLMLSRRRLASLFSLVLLTRLMALTQLGWDEPPDILPFPPPSLSRLSSLCVSVLPLFLSFPHIVVNTEKVSLQFNSSSVSPTRTHSESLFMSFCSYDKITTVPCENFLQIKLFDSL